MEHDLHGGDPGGVVPPVESNLPTAYSNAGFNFSGQNAYDMQFLSPYQGYGNIEYLQFDGNANYNSLQVSLQRRFSKGLTFGVAYTYSKALTTASADEDYVTPFESHKYDYRPADFDRTHVLAVNYVYNLPNLTQHYSGPKWLSYITDDYQLSGFTSVMSGAPLPSWAGTAALVHSPGPRLRALKLGQNTDFEAQLISITNQRDALAAQMIALLEGAAFNGQEIDKDEANHLIAQAQALLAEVNNLP